jgi:hypothetical protein
MSPRILVLLISSSAILSSCDSGDSGPVGDVLGLESRAGDVRAGETTDPQGFATEIIDEGSVAQSVGASPWLHVDIDNVLHVSYTSTGVDGLRLWYATNAGGAWVREEVGPAGGSERSSVIVSEVGSVPRVAWLGEMMHLMFATRFDQGWEIDEVDASLCGHVAMGYVEEPSSGHVFYRKEGGHLGHMILKSKNNDDWVDCAVDGEDFGGEMPAAVIRPNLNNDAIVHVAHSQNWPEPFVLRYSRFIGEAKMETQVIDDALPEWGPTSIAVDPNDGVHVVVYDGYYTDVDGGWTREVFLPGARGPSITAEAAHNVHVCSTVQDTLFYSFKEAGGEWVHTALAEGLEFDANLETRCHIALGRGVGGFDTVHVVFQASGKLHHARFPRYFTKD